MPNEKNERADAPVDPAAFVDAMESDRFKQFLDHIPVAVAVSELTPSEIVTYANLEFQRLTGKKASEIEGKSWRTLPGIASADGDERSLRDAVKEDSDYIGVFTINLEAGSIDVDVWSNTIENEDGRPIYRLVAMSSTPGTADERNAKETALQNDVLLRELQHRVKNNLQMITALIRLEARNSPGSGSTEGLVRLAGRINALAVLYDALSRDDAHDKIDLGAYLGQIASAVMLAHATEGVRLDTKIDTWPVSINVAMPAGLVVNEVLTNSLKHAFTGREGGVIKLHSLIGDDGYRIMVADDGVGLPTGAIWPQPGKLGAIIVQSLEQNAAAKVSVDSSPGKGVVVTISFAGPASQPSIG